MNHSDHSPQAPDSFWVAELVMIAVLGRSLLLGSIEVPGTIAVLRTSVVVGRIAMLGTLVRIGMIPVLRTSVVVGRIAMLGMLLVILVPVGEPTTSLSAVDSLLEIWLSMTVTAFDDWTALSLKVRVVAGTPIVSVPVKKAVPLKVTVSGGNVGAAGGPDTR